MAGVEYTPSEVGYWTSRVDLGQPHPREHSNEANMSRGRPGLCVYGGVRRVPSVMIEGPGDIHIDS